MLAETVVEWTQQWKMEGLRAGLDQGRQEGIEQGIGLGESTLLERQLTKRFGPLSEATLTRLRSATTNQLELWADRILDAPTLGAVFEGH